MEGLGMKSLTQACPEPGPLPRLKEMCTVPWTAVTSFRYLLAALASNSSGCPFCISGMSPRTMPRSSALYKIPAYLRFRKTSHPSKIFLGFDSCQHVLSAARFQPATKASISTAASLKQKACDGPNSLLGLPPTACVFLCLASETRRWKRLV